MTYFITAEMLPEFFANVTYDIRNSKAVLPNGSRANRYQFNVHFGGHKFSLNDRNTETTTSAWIAFTRNPVFQYTLTP